YALRVDAWRFRGDTILLKDRADHVSCSVGRKAHIRIAIRRTAAELADAEQFPGQVREWRRVAGQLPALQPDPNNGRCRKLVVANVALKPCRSYRGCGACKRRPDGRRRDQ